MKFKSFFIFSLILLTTIISLNFFAFRYYWYWRWRWFDKPMHFLGGLLVGLVFFQLYFYFFKRDKFEGISIWEIFMLSLLPILLIGIGWELLEFTADQIYVFHVNLKTIGLIYQGWRESVADLTFNFMGSMTAGILLMSNLLWQTKKQQR